MPKEFSEYAFADVLRLQPLLHTIKSYRYRRLDQRFLAKPSRGSEVGLVLPDIADKNILLTVAFEDPDILDAHLRLCRKFVASDTHIVGDNSRDAAVVQVNRRITEANGAYHIWLPENPWSSRNAGSRSHGAAMTWLWRNVLKPRRPKAFGFLDHDLFPTEPENPFELLSRHDFHGDQRSAGKRWFLWAGYCFFNFSAVETIDLDFGLDWFAGLDTGGANYEVLYKHVDRHALPRREIITIPALDGIPVSRACFERRGSWIHEVGWGTDPDCRVPKREALMTLLNPLLE
jgi:hypothetical protein